MKQLALIALLLALLAAPGVSQSHSDLVKPLYVSSAGSDNGDCQAIDAACRSLEYALRQAGKGGVIRVTRGRYDVRDPGTLFSIISGAIDVRGGYDPLTGEADGGTTTLTGVPAEYRRQLIERGFHIVADRKADGANLQKLLDKQESIHAGLSAAPCTGGQSGGLDCDQVGLVSHLPLGGFSATPGASADIWGFVDLNSFREYAIIGFDIGAAVVDISDPENPREIGFVDGQRTVWRDIKVHQRYDATTGRWQAYAYVTTDGVGDGLFVIDLTELPHRISRVNYSSDFSQAHNVFAVNTDYATGLSITPGGSGLVIAGSNNGTGILRTYGLAVLDDPFLGAAGDASEATCNSDGCYMHDAASLIIRDSRTNQCPNAVDYCEVLFDFNESTVDLWDITRITDPIRLSRTPYPGAEYTHSGWPSEDGLSLFVHDELDERRNAVSETTVRVFSISDLLNPTLSGTWSGPDAAIDHNGFVRGNRYYMSNYSSGLVVLDISDPTTPVTAGFLDTYPFPTGAAFVGAWGAYPFFPSGNIAISDIESGLFLAEDLTLDVPQGSLAFTADSYAVEESGTVSLGVQRTGGGSGPTSVGYEILHGTTIDNDVAVSGTLSWANGDTGTRNIDITALLDAETEELEQLFVKLVAPTGGATLSVPNMVPVYLSESGTGSSIEFDRDSIRVGERGFGTAVAVVRRSGSAVGAASVDYSVTDIEAVAGSDYTGPSSGTLSWADGDATPRWIEFTITDDASSEPDERFEIVLANQSGASLGSKPRLEVAIADGDGVNEPPVANAGASSIVASGSLATLDGSASSDPDGDSLSFVWTQTLGPTVSLSGAATPTATFTAPSVSSDQVLRFQLDVSDPNGASDTASVSVTVSAPSSSAGGDSGGGGGGAVTLYLLLALLLSRRLTRTDAA